MKKDLSSRIFLSITGSTENEWRDKLEEISDLKLDTIALFLESYERNQRDMIYEALEKSNIKNIPLIHIRNDMEKGELEYLSDKYNKPFMTIHENTFGIMEKWHGFYKELYLELDYNNSVSQKVEVEKIGGFCIDLAHFKAAEEKWSKEFEYITGKEENKNLFACNHLSGYSYDENKDVHSPDNLKYFDYLKTLPDFIFGDVVAIEIYNSIADQIKFRDYILKSQ